MKCTVSVYIFCYVGIVGSGEFFQSRLQCKSARAIFLLILCYGNVELYVVISEKKYFTEYHHGYVIISKHRYIIRRYYLLCETLVEHPTSFVEASQKR